jgi:alkylation response protein AidB-like acyl-CoA dehydrogenase
VTASAQIPGINSAPPDPERYREQMSTVCAALEAAMLSRDFTEFYRLFRSNDLPFMPAAYQQDATGLFHLCFEFLHRLGSVSPATALAIENHLYVTSAIATFPITDAALNRRRNALVDLIVQRRMLVANTNSKVHTDKLGDIGTRARRDLLGFRIRGKASYTSLSTQGDLLVFLTEIEGEGRALFALPMQKNPDIEIGAYLFPSAMLDSDTRQITFHDLVAPEESLLAGGRDQDIALLVSFEMVWHQLLIPSLYLGAAARAIEEARQFLCATRSRDDRPLAELDGMMIDIGRLVIEYRGACSAVWRAGEALGQVKCLPRDAALLEKAADLASAAKYIGARTAEAVVTAARRILGARCFSGGHPLERLSQEIMFASLGPEVSAVIERRAGRQALQQRSFLDSCW